MNASDLMAKAAQAQTSAKVLLDRGDADGACNRAYYAMFDAARAALLASGAPVEPEVIRTHDSLIAVFSPHLVKTGKVPIALGKSLNKVEELRLVADHNCNATEIEDAAWAVDEAEAFVQAIGAIACR